MTPQQFAALAVQNYNRIPVSREVLADFETPLSAYLKLGAGPWSYLFESVYGGEKWGRYSIIGLPCASRLRIHGYQVEVLVGEDVTESCEVADPLQFVEEFQTRYRVPELPGLPMFYN